MGESPRTRPFAPDVQSTAANRARAAERQIAFNDPAKLTLETDISGDLQKPEFERV